MAVRRTILFIGAFVFGLSGAFAQKGKKETDRSKEMETENYFTEATKYYILEDFAKAYALYGEALDRDPENPAINFKIADVLFRTDNLGKALFYAQKAMELDDQNAFYYLLTVEILAAQANYTEAAEVYISLMDNIEGYDHYLFELAAIYLYQQKYDQALDTYNRAEAIFGASEEVSLQKTHIYLKTNQLDLAIAEMKMLVSLNPMEIGYVLELVEILASNNKAPEAVALLDNLSEDAKKEGGILMAYYDLYSKNNEEVKSYAVLTEIALNEWLPIEVKLQRMAPLITSDAPEEKQLLVDLLPLLLATHAEDSRAHTFAGDIYLNWHQDREAKDAYVQAANIDGSDFKVWLNILQLELQLQEIDSVIFYADRALEYFPNQALIYHFQGTAYSIQKKYELAKVALERGNRLAVDDLSLRSGINAQLGDVYNNLKDYKKADAAYERALEANPANDYVLNNYSYYLAIRGENLSRAMELSSYLVRRNPTNATYLDTYAWVLYKNKKYTEAKKAMQRALQQDTSATLLEHNGDILYKLGNVDEAVENWKRARGMNNNSELLDKKIADRKLYE